jgi:DNA-directed RNA polymerase
MLRQGVDQGLWAARLALNGSRMQMSMSRQMAGTHLLRSTHAMPSVFQLTGAFRHKSTSLDSSTSSGMELTGLLSDDANNHHYQNKLDILGTLSLMTDKVADIDAMAKVDEVYAIEATTAQKHSGLYYRQIHIEEEQMQDAVNTYTESLKTLMDMGRGTTLNYIQKILLEWYEPLSVALTEEIKDIQMKKPGNDRSVYGPCLLLLPVEKLTVLTLNTVLNAILKSGNAGVNVNQCAMMVGNLLESEVNINKLKMGSGKTTLWQKDLIKEAYANTRHARAIGARIRMLLGDEGWSSQLKVKVGAVLIQILLETAKHGDVPAFVHTTWYKVNKMKSIGLLRLDESCFKLMAEREMHTVLPRYLPMIVPPKDWDNTRKTSCYFRLKSTLMRAFNRSQIDAVRRAEMDGVLEGLNFIGSIPWRINKPMFEIFKTALEHNHAIGELPTHINFELPEAKDCYSLPSQKYERKYNKKKSTKAEELVAAAEAALAPEVEPTPEPTEPAEPEVPAFDERLFIEMCRRVKLKNAELHSLRCDTQLKYWVAEKFLEDVMYFPVNMDFRGRAYPIPPNLSIVGSDLCRALLTFAEKKKLGENGFFWLKVHLCNLFGNNKIAFDDRAAWTEEHLREIHACVANPFGDHDDDKFWTNADDPFQALAAMHEIVNALKLENPGNYYCSLPIHMDGSCNGLQHYAALGRDEVGGASVNLTPSDKPQDVYSKVLDIVHARLANDATLPDTEGIEHYNLNKEFKLGKDMYAKEDKLTVAEDVKIGHIARFLQNIIDRKVIKQTVMTSVYGVTHVGARAQVQARLEEKIYKGVAVMTPEKDKELFQASHYLANLTLKSLEEMFSGAKDILLACLSCSLIGNTLRRL